MRYFVKILQKSIPRDFFSTSVLRNVVSGSDSSCRSLVKRALASGDLIQLKRGVYLLGPDYRRGPIDLFELAQVIQSPSYVSFESALSFHGIIPEMTTVVASATPGRAKRYTNECGTYVYSHIGGSPFFDGVRREVRPSGAAFLVAMPERALVDLIYERKLEWTGMELLLDGYRMDEQAIQQMSSRVLRRLARQTRLPVVARFVDALLHDRGRDE